MKELKMKDALVLTGLILGGFIAYALGGVFLRGFSENLQVFIEQLLGYSLIPLFMISGIRDFILAAKIKSAYIKYSSPVVNSSYALMYFLYLAYNYGQIQVHISAIGFSLATVLYVINHLIMTAIKENKRD